MTLFTRRTAVSAVGAFAAVAVVALSGCASQGASEGGGESSAPTGPVVVANWGGLASEAYQAAYIEPFTAETGIEVQQVDAPGLFVARTEAQAAANRTEWDVLESITDSDVEFLAAQDLLDPIPADVKERLVAELGEENVTDYGYHSGTTAMLIVCNTDRVAVCPQSMEEFWDVDEFPEKRAIIGFNPIYPITAAQMAMGVPRDEVATTPIDVDATFAKLEELRPAVSVIYTTVDQGTQVLDQGEADMAIFYATRIYSELIPQGNYEVVWTDGARAQGTSVVLKDAPHKAAAWELLEWNATHLEEQADFAVQAQKAPISAAALEFVPDDQHERFANAPEHEGDLAVPNAADFNSKFDEINRLWQEFIAG